MGVFRLFFVFFIFCKFVSAQFTNSTLTSDAGQDIILTAKAASFVAIGERASPDAVALMSSDPDGGIVIKADEERGLVDIETNALEISATGSFDLLTDGGSDSESEFISIRNSRGTQESAIKVEAMSGGIVISAATSATISSSETLHMSSSETLALESQGQLSLTTFSSSADIVLESAGVILLSASDDTPNTIHLRTGPTEESSQIHLENIAGTSDNAISIEALAPDGGISLMAGASTGNLFMDAGGSLNIGSSGSVVGELNLGTGGERTITIGSLASRSIFTSSAGPITFETTTDDSRAIYLHSSTGASAGIHLYQEDSEAPDAILAHASHGGITLTTQESSKDISLIAENGSVDVTAGEGVIDAINLSATNGGIVMGAGGGGVTIEASGPSTVRTTGGDLAFSMSEIADASLVLSSSGTGSTAMQLVVDSGVGTGDFVISVEDDLSVEADEADFFLGSLTLDTAGIVLVDAGASVSLAAAGPSGFTTASGGLSLATTDDNADVSLLLSSKGTGADAMKIVVDSTGNTGDLDIDVEDDITLNSDAITAVVGSVDVDSGGAVQINSAGASHFVTSTGGLTFATTEDDADVSLLLSSKGTGADAMKIVVNSSGNTGDLDIDVEDDVTLAADDVAMDLGSLAVAAETGIDMDATGAISLDAGGASRFVTSSGSITIATTDDNENVSLLLSSMGTGSDALKIVVDSSGDTGDLDIDVEDDVVLTADAISFEAGAFDLDVSSFVDIDVMGSVTIGASSASEFLTSAGGLTLATMDEADVSLLLSSRGTGAGAMRIVVDSSDNTGDLDIDVDDEIVVASGGLRGVFDGPITLDSTDAVIVNGAGASHFMTSVGGITVATTDDDANVSLLLSSKGTGGDAMKIVV
eukprot:Rmarinus@m.1181